MGTELTPPTNRQIDAIIEASNRANEGPRDLVRRAWAEAVTISELLKLLPTDSAPGAVLVDYATGRSIAIAMRTHGTLSQSLAAERFFEAAGDPSCFLEQPLYMGLGEAIGPSLSQDDLKPPELGDASADEDRYRDPTNPRIVLHRCAVMFARWDGLRRAYSDWLAPSGNASLQDDIRAAAKRLRRLEEKVNAKADKE